MRGRGVDGLGWEEHEMRLRTSVWELEVGRYVRTRESERISIMRV